LIPSGPLIAPLPIGNWMADRLGTQHVFAAAQ
jgi:hypothetical protein